ncbi:cytochrome C oxidase subunit II [Mesobacillus subterraneus]|uniref:cytochrome C oxidase subunit II n=1 Tax=Mesobacillus subterraneus TaxID=285983 RepID=UPI00204218B5|nr:cytochrome C oxidase subunit II [Mesobacillus subterraneus]MCM3665037.1 cytochrome C oxidase subunit II [Mesobacillus subterraneus]MCM3684052.1 cytochrome C oxidase subunit II [Mesobacillus subterraneus]
MKKFGLMLLTGALTISLAACGGTEEKANTSAGNEENAAASADQSVEEFTITATNWEFTSDRELTIQKGKKVKLNLVNKEGLHTIGNDELGLDLKADAPSEFTAEKTGEYKLICSTVCGAAEDHEEMVIKLNIVD